MDRTNSKATLRLDLSKIQPTMPAMIFDQLKSSRYYAHGRESLVIQSDTSRRQADNKEQCFTKLTEEIGMLARNVVTSETSAAQRTRVKNLYGSSRSVQQSVNLTVILQETGEQRCATQSQEALEC